MRFVIITLAPDDLASTIDDLRRPFNRPGCSEALEYPPHVTLRTGLVCPDDQAATVAGEFLEHASRCRRASIRTQGLFSAVSPGEGGEQLLVGWSVVPQEELLALHQNLLLYQKWPKGPQGPFHPHLSLVYGPRPIVGDPRPKAPDFEWTADHVALFFRGPEAWVEWGRTSLR